MAAAGDDALNCTVKIGRVTFYVNEETYSGFANGLTYQRLLHPLWTLPDHGVGGSGGVIPRSG